VSLDLLPCRPTTAQSARYVERIVTTYRVATDDQVQRGTDWYPAARRIAEE